MVSDLDIFRSAKQMIDEHGDKATIHAGQRADELLEAGDTEGAATWCRIIKSIRDMTEAEGTRH